MITALLSNTQKLQIFHVAVQKACVGLHSVPTEHRTDVNSHWIDSTLDLFFSDLHFGFCPIWEVKRTAWELSGISIRVWCDFEKFLS